MKHFIFEYIYRDAGNFKACNELLLEGDLSEDEIGRIRRRFESEELFIAEQIGVPPLYEVLWRECECEPSSEMDHVWHELCAIRAADDTDLSRLKVWGKAKSLLASIESVETWNLQLSRNWDL
jgi:hypothetical protein